MNVVCFASLNNETSWSMKEGCLNQNGCNIIIKGILSNNLISWQLFMTPGEGTALVSINEHPEPFISDKDYFFTELKRLSDEFGTAEHKIHTTGPNRDQVSDLPCQYDEESEFMSFNDSYSCPLKKRIIFTSIRSATEVEFMTKTKLYYEVEYGKLRPYVSYDALPLYIHLKLVRSNGVIELVSSKPFYLFKEKNNNNNAHTLIPANEVAPCTDGECNKFDILGITEKPTSKVPQISSKSSTTVKEEKGNATTIIIVVVVVVLLLLTFIGLLFLFLCRNRKPKTKVTKVNSKNNISTASSDLRSDIAMK